MTFLVCFSASLAAFSSALLAFSTPLAALYSCCFCHVCCFKSALVGLVVFPAMPVLSPPAAELGSHVGPVSAGFLSIVALPLSVVVNLGSPPLLIPPTRAIISSYVAARPPGGDDSPVGPKEPEGCDVVDICLVPPICSCP